MRRGGGLIEEQVSNMAGKMGDTAARVVGCRKLEDVVGRGVVRGSDVVCGEVGGEVDLGTLFGLAGGYCSASAAENGCRASPKSRSR
jgi:hypothetical protein